MIGVGETTDFYSTKVRKERSETHKRTLFAFLTGGCYYDDIFVDGIRTHPNACLELSCEDNGRLLVKGCVDTDILVLCLTLKTWFTYNNRVIYESNSILFCCGPKHCVFFFTQGGYVYKYSEKRSLKTL